MFLPQFFIKNLPIKLFKTISVKYFFFYNMFLLPLRVKGVVHFSVGDCKHHNQDPETLFFSPHTTTLSEEATLKIGRYLFFNYWVKDLRRTTLTRNWYTTHIGTTWEIACEQIFKSSWIMFHIWIDHNPHRDHLRAHLSLKCGRAQSSLCDVCVPFCDSMIFGLTAVCRFSDPFLRLITHSANCWLVTYK